MQIEDLEVIRSMPIIDLKRRLNDLNKARMIRIRLDEGFLRQTDKDRIEKLWKLLTSGDKRSLGHNL